MKLSEIRKISTNPPISGSADELDLKILELLQENPRMTYAELAERVALSRDGIKYRINKLEQKGIIKGFGVTLDYSLLGFGNKTLLNVSFNAPESELLTEFGTYMRKIGIVLETYSCLGVWDITLVLVSKDNGYLNELLLKAKTKFAGKIRAMEVVPVVK